MIFYTGNRKHCQVIVKPDSSVSQLLSAAPLKTVNTNHHEANAHSKPPAVCVRHRSFSTAERMFESTLIVDGVMLSVFSFRLFGCVSVCCVYTLQGTSDVTNSPICCFWLFMCNSTVVTNEG